MSYIYNLHLHRPYTRIPACIFWDFSHLRSSLISRRWGTPSIWVLTCEGIIGSFWLPFHFGRSDIV